MHALTDVTGFGLAGHLLEILPGVVHRCDVDFARVPLLPGVGDLAAAGMITGASARNWAGCADAVHWERTPRRRARAADRPADFWWPFVACAPEAVDDVLANLAPRVLPTPP